MPTEETTDTTSDYFEIRINKSLVKKVTAVVAAVAAVTGVVYVAKNLSIENTEESVTVELDKA